jgi:hypothetical protein
MNTYATVPHFRNVEIVLRVIRVFENVVGIKVSLTLPCFSKEMGEVVKADQVWTFHALVVERNERPIRLREE